MGASPLTPNPVFFWLYHNVSYSYGICFIPKQILTEKVIINILLSEEGGEKIQMNKNEFAIKG